MKVFEYYISLLDDRHIYFFSDKHRQLIELMKEGNKTEKEIMTIICEGKYEASYYRNVKSKTLKILQSLSIFKESKGGSLVKKKI